MSKKTLPVFFSCKKYLETIGINIKLARLKRNLSMDNVANRAGINSKTLREIEQGSDSVKIGSYVNVLAVLKLENTLENVAAKDIVGDNIINAQLLNKRAKKSGPVITRIKKII